MLSLIIIIKKKYVEEKKIWSELDRTTGGAGLTQKKIIIKKKNKIDWINKKMAPDLSDSLLEW